MSGRLASLLLLVLLASPARATTRDVPGDYPLLQDALDASLEGDTVRVAAGDYAGPFVMPGGVTLVGAGAGLTTLDGAGTSRVLDCLAGSGATPSRVEDLRLTSGRAGMGGLLRAQDSARLEAARVRLEDGVATVAGGGLFASPGSQVRLADVEIATCTAPRGAGAAALGATLGLERAQIHHNQAAELGGGAWLAGGGQLGWLEGSCHDNRSQGDGGGVAVSGGQATVSAARIADNTAGLRGGGAYAASGSSLLLSYVEVVGNQAGVAGGGVATSCAAPLGPARLGTACSVLQLVQSDLLRNRAPAGAAGAAEGESRIEAIASIIADHPSGLVCSDPLAQLVVQCSLVYGNGEDLAGSCGPAAGPGWVQDDPRFCDLDARDLRLCANSPALDPGCAAAYFGAHGPGCAACAPSPTRRSSWGALKGRYR